jgi:transposase
VTVRKNGSQVLPVDVRENPVIESYKVAGIDVHKRMLAVVITDVAADGEASFQRQKFATMDSDLQRLGEWLTEQQVQEAVRESTAPYGKPVWRQWEGKFRLHLAQAQSNRAPRGRKRDFGDAERLVRRHVAGELILSFVPDPEQRMWRTLTRSKYPLTRDRVRRISQLESLLEDGRIKLATCIRDLVGVSGRRILAALAERESNPLALAALAEPELRASPETLTDALQAAMDWSSLHRQILKLFLERLQLIDQQIGLLKISTANSMREHQEAVLRLAKVPGYGVESAQPVVAETGPRAGSFPTPGPLASWVGVCPGREESAEVSNSDRTPKGNRAMRRILNQVANAAAKTKGSIYQSIYRRLVPRLGHNNTIWAIAHRLCRLTWKILHEGVEYIEYGENQNPAVKQKRINRLVRQLKALGYQVLPPVRPVHV